MEWLIVHLTKGTNMKTKTISVYEFSELSDTAKQRAKDDFAASDGYCWSDDMLESITKLAEHFDGKVKDYNLDWFDSSPSSMDFNMPDMEPGEIESRLGQLGTFDAKTLRGNGDCKLTGYCGDEDAIDGFRQAWHKGERDLTALMDAAFGTWIKAAQADCKSHYSDEQFTEFCQANDYEFYEDGEIA